MTPLSAGDVQFETAGALGKGERIFITDKLPDYIKVGRDGLIEKYLFLTTSHNGLDGITLAFTPVRIVCANILNAAMQDKSNAVKIRHTSNAKRTTGLGPQSNGDLQRAIYRTGTVF